MFISDEALVEKGMTAKKIGSVVDEWQVQPPKVKTEQIPFFFFFFFLKKKNNQSYLNIISISWIAKVELLENKLKLMIFCKNLYNNQHFHSHLNYPLWQSQQ